ncbi:nuclear transport factor 2 family protein [Clostridium sediminicola]|uniref:ester cyclase n=1 Tax=Clostridium sediminicola TaxID=3114879 RepID=UPI0031F2543C
MSSVRIKNKQRIYEFSKHIRKANSQNIDSVLSEYFHEDAVWYGPHPFNTLNGLESISNNFYKPLLTSFPDIQKNDIFLTGGSFAGAEGEWVSTMGNFVATFEKDFLEIPATKNVVWLRFGEFHKMENGKIVETRIIVDILDLMRQAGIKFISALGKETFCPVPSTMNGVILGESDDVESTKTLKLVENMLYKGLRDDYHYNGVYGMGMEYYFHEDFMWYGPGGTGTTRGLKGFLDYHCDPFCKGIPDWNGGNHLTRFAEGNFCSFVGWPSIYATHTGDGWLGLPATNKKITMRVMDFYRREDNLLAENWVFIDMVDFLLQIGIDVFDRMKGNLNIFKSN